MPSYEIVCECSNCGSTFNLFVEKGISAHSFIEGAYLDNCGDITEITCPNCDLCKYTCITKRQPLSERTE